MIYWEETGSKKYLKLLRFKKKIHAPLVKPIGVLNSGLEFGDPGRKTGMSPYQNLRAAKTQVTHQLLYCTFIHEKLYAPTRKSH